jgi:hypothetical protein
LESNYHSLFALYKQSESNQLTGFVTRMLIRNGTNKRIIQLIIIFQQDDLPKLRRDIYIRPFYIISLTYGHRINLALLIYPNFPK